MTTFTLAYPDDCAVCDVRMPPGTQGRFVSFGEVAHVRCPTPAPVCPVHNVAVPATGVCEGCE